MSKPNLVLVRAGSPHAFDPSALREFDGDPRIRDIDLAKRLGMADLHKIRALIRKNEVELKEYGPISARQAEISNEVSSASEGSRGRGRPGRDFWLNEGQALVLCALSRTVRAAEVRRALIECFLAHRRRKVSSEGGVLDALERLTDRLDVLASVVARIEAAAPIAPPAPIERSHDPLAALVAVGERMAKAPTGDRADLINGVAAIAEYLGMQPRRVHYLKDHGHLPFFRLGGRICATRASLDAHLAALAAGKVVLS